MIDWIDINELYPDKSGRYEVVVVIGLNEQTIQEESMVFTDSMIRRKREINNGFKKVIKWRLVK